MSQERTSADFVTSESVTGSRESTASESVTGSRESTTSEVSRAVLEARARALAQPLVAPETSASLSLITFMLQQEFYAVESLVVREVCRDVEVTELPGAVRPIYGVTAWRGEIVPVVDVRSLVGLSAASATARTWLVVVGGTGDANGSTAASGGLGLAADGPGELRMISAQSLRPPPEGMVASPYVRGMLPDGVLVLDAQRVLEVAGPESV